jgi:oxygen-dependent protoporphyrinogen oxidase
VTATVSDSEASRPLRVAVIGGGITGLAAAQRLVSKSDAVQVTLFESSRRLGGIIRTEEADGFLIELGPDSFITNKPAGLRLCQEIGFAEQLIPTDARYRRSLVLRNGQPVAVPDGFMLMAPAKPWAIMTTPVLSLVGKLRLLAEAFVGRKAAPDDESLASFVRRRFGRQALDRLVQPLVGGIYTSDPEKLSLKATMPRFLDMEQSHGSVIRATLAQQKSEASSERTSGSGARYGLFVSADKGLSSLTGSLETWLKKSGRVQFRIGCAITEISPPNGQHPKWRVSTEGSTVPEEFDAVIMTLPTHAAARLLPDQSLQDLTVLLKQIEYASSAIVVSGHKLSDFRSPMDAFGLVIPAIENRKILAVSFSSRKFLNRAPEGHILLRTFVGGAMQPELLQMDDDAMVATVNSELKDIFGMSADPMFSEVVRYNNAMPQYHVGHLELIAQIESAQAKIPGLQLAGSAYYGVGIPDSIASGQTAADRVLKGQVA